MKSWIYLLIFLLSISCISKSQKGDYETKLKTLFGPDQYILLTSLIQDMESHLCKTYDLDELGDCYKSYFVNYSLGDSHLKLETIHCLSVEKFENSGLSDLYEWVPYDTVYLQDGFVIQIIDHDTIKGIIPGYVSDKELEQFMENKKHRNVLHKGKLNVTLLKLETDNIHINQYIERKKNVWVMNPKMMAVGFIAENIDLSNNIVLKAIVFQEIYLVDLKGRGVEIHVQIVLING